MRRRVFISWLFTGIVIFLLFLTGSGLAWLVVGLLLLGWGLAVASNYRGIADAMPTRHGIGPFWQQTSPAMLRLMFAFFAVMGVLFLIEGIARAS
jgi:hypothetical protein